MTQRKILFRHQLNTVGLLSVKDVYDVAPNQSEGDDSAGCRVNMQDRGRQYKDGMV